LVDDRIERPRDIQAAADATENNDNPDADQANQKTSTLTRTTASTTAR
jgi:hypothetical protein